MANYSAIKAAVNAYIKANGKKEITGHILNSVLNATIDSLGRYFQFAGGAMPTDDPGTPDQNVCYLAGEPGVYTNFGGITIENEEVALLFWDGEWTKQRVLLGIQEVEASVDNQVGTPSVDVSYSGGQLVLTFHNIKGEQGIQGDAAGFGTIGADINGGVGTPGVSVESSGDNTAKNLMFHFTNLKGDTGVTSVVATIDETSGTPSCQVSLVNGVLTLAFSGLKGLKGDTGVSADYPITLYNGLDSDATDQALAAAQGKVLDGKISQLEAKVNENIFGEYSPEWELGNISISGNGWTYSNSNKRVRLKQGTTLHLYPGDIIKLSDHQTIRFYLCWRNLDGTYGANAWSQDDFVVSAEGDYVILMTSVPEATESSVSNLASKISFVANHILKDHVEKLEYKEENTSGRYDYVLYVSNPGTHSSTIDLHPIDYIAGTTIKGKITPGTAVSDGTSTRIYLYDSSGNAIGNKLISLNEDFEFSVNQDAAFVSFYISSITTIGTFLVSLKYGGLQELQNSFPLGNVTGYGSINLSSRFKETLYSFPEIAQTIFDTSLYAVGVQSVCIYEDTYALFVINGTEIGNTAHQKIGFVIVDIVNREKLGEFEILTNNLKSHGNNVCFGEKYAEDDTLPLVYVSLTYTPYECYVIRIDNGFASYTKVQEIVYGGTGGLSDKYTVDWIVEGGNLWAYGSIWDSNEASVQFVKFPLPSTSNPSVSLSDLDILDDFTVGDLRIAQGAIISNGKIYIGLGYTVGVEFVKVLDIQTRGIVTVIPLSYEPEGLSVYNGKLAVTRSGNHFRFITYEDGI